jgi:integrase
MNQINEMENMSLESYGGSGGISSLRCGLFHSRLIKPFAPELSTMLNQKAAVAEAATYSPEKLQRLVSVLWNSREEPRTLSALLYVVLGAFAGLRPAEAVALEWKHIDFSRQVISLVPPVSKIARVVPIKSNLMDFLAPFKNRNGLVVMHKKVANLLRNECIQAGVAHIPNGLRRSYAANRLAEVSEEMVRAEMGLDSSAQNEWKAATPQAAAKYWAVTP